MAMLARNEQNDEVEKWRNGMLMALLRGVLVVLIGIYLITLLAAVFYSERMIFQPQQAGYRDNDAILKLTSSGGAKISATYLPNPDATFTMLFSHGNAEDIGDDRAHLARIRDAGFAVFAYDYQGYGTSEGKPSERHAYDDEDAAYNFLVQTMHIQPTKIIAFGRSLGSGPAVDLASRRPVAGLILESAFTSTFRVMTRISVFPFDRFDNLHKIKKVRCPLLIIHGTQDSVINAVHGRELFAAANEPKRALWVEGANHNDVAVVGGAQYSDALKAFAILIQRYQS
jgi:pimeloyl-ACP methyl ester carboxylesterase